MNTNIDEVRIIKLQKVSEEHLFYEIWMLYEVTFRLANGISDDVYRNAMIESFGIHAAIVLEFLFSTGSKSDDLRATDFVNDESEWMRICSVHTEKFSFIANRRHKEIAHLSYKRLEVSAEEKDWHHVAITREISDLVDLFINSANKDLLNVKVLSLKNFYRSNAMWRFVSDFDGAPMRSIV